MMDLQPVIESLKAELAKVDAGIEAMEQLQRFRRKYSSVDPPAAGATITEWPDSMLPAKPDQQKGCSRCPEVNGIGERCVRRLGHDGEHMSTLGACELAGTVSREYPEEKS